MVFCGEGGSQTGRLAETLNAAAKERLPLLILCIDNGRAINTSPGGAESSAGVGGAIASRTRRAEEKSPRSL